MRDIRERNWFWVDNALMDRTDIDLYEKMLYVALARFCDNQGRAFPSFETLMKVTGIKSKNTLMKYLKSLEEKGLMQKIKKNGRKNIYFLKNVENIKENDISALNEPVPTYEPNQYQHMNQPVPTYELNQYQHMNSNNTQEKDPVKKHNNKKENSVAVAVVAGENSEEEIYKPITETGEEKINSALKNEVRLLLGTRKIDPQKIINLGKPITRIKQVIDYCNAHSKNNGYLLCALRDDYELYEPTPKTREEPYHPKKTRQEEEFLF